MTHDTDVLVIGAGPVGLTLANELARHGLKPRIIDKAPGIREVSKAMILHVRTQEVLDKVGVSGRLAAEAQPLTEVVVHAYGKHIGAWDLDNIDSVFKHPLILGQNRTQHVLLDHLNSRSVEVEWNTEAVALEMRDDAAAITLKRTVPAGGAVSEERVSARYVVGCEGSNSVVRKALGLTFEGERYSGEQFVQADCRIQWALPKGRSYLFLTDVGYLMVIEFPNDVVRIFISLPDEEASEGAKSASNELGAAEATSEEPTLDEIARHLTELSGFACELSDPTWLARYRTSHRYANRFRQGCAFLAGDAGHVHVPIGGQGMNTGIQDAFNLGWKLAGVAQGRLRLEVLDSYNAERHPVAEGLIKGTDRAYRGILEPSQAQQVAARLFGPFVIGNPAVQTFMRNTLEELNVFYPSSPLNLDLGGANGPKPGERVLDAPTVRASDQATVTVRDLTKGGNWTALLFSGLGEASEIQGMEALASKLATRFGDGVCPYLVVPDAARPPNPAIADRWLVDALGLLHQRYGVTRAALYILRPDTYVAARAPMDEAERLLVHLDGIIQPT